MAAGAVAAAEKPTAPKPQSAAKAKKATPEAAKKKTNAKSLHNP
jgi:hypothetical protein